MKTLFWHIDFCLFSLPTPQEAQAAVHEARSLRSKLQLAEQAQRAARGTEQDYEEVVRVLEMELTESRAQQHNKHLVGMLQLLQFLLQF